MKSCLVFVGAALIAAIAGCSHPVRKAESVSLVRPEVQRDPAAVGALKLFEGMDVQLFQDYFHFDTRGKKFRYVVKSRLWTDMDKKYMSGKVKKALDEAVAKTLQPDAAGGSLADKLKKNLMSEFLKQFVFTLQFYKIFDGTIQFDLYFVPEADSPADYSPELSSNRLVRLGDTGHLRERMESENSWSVTGQLGQTVRKLVEATRESGTQPPYLYSGGVITVYLKLLDMRWNPFKPIPNPKKNALKGFVRYRRYFVNDGKIQASASCTSNRLKVRSLGWQSQDPASLQLVTADYYKSFNLAGFLPKPDTIEIFPGRWLAPNQGRRGLLPGGPGAIVGLKSHKLVGKTLKSGLLSIQGESTAFASPTPFDYRLSGIVYDLEKKRFDAALSAKAGFSGEVTPVDAESGVVDATEGLLSDCQDYFTRALSLERLMTPARAIEAGGEQ